LTNREYEEAIVDLHGRSPPSPTKSQEKAIRKQEFSLMIDHRLGREFPERLREELWCVHERIERRRLGLAARSALWKLSLSSRSREAHSLANLMVDEYAKVIGRAEAQRFFGLEPGEKPSLPVELDN
jgi:hypothetical protein